MTPDIALQLMNETLLAMLWIGAPLLGLSMAVGLLVSIFQVVTQVQEMSLTFIPKVITVGVTLVFFGPWMLKKLLAFATMVIGRLPSYL